MNQNKKRGLQHKLSDILKPAISLDEKTTYTSELLSRVAPKSSPTLADAQQIPIDKDAIPGQQDQSSMILETSVYQTLVPESPVDQQTPVSDRHQLNRNIAAIAKDNLFITSDQQTPVTNSHQAINVENSFTKVPNLVFDKLMRILDPYEFKVYLRLYRLSHGFHKTSCLVGYSALEEACGLSIRHIKRVIPILESKNLIKVISVYNNRQIKGTLYEVYAVEPHIMVQVPVSNRHQCSTDTGVQLAHNKDRDHDDFKKIDHHQSAHAAETTKIYEKLTGNQWTKSDTNAYEKIKDIPIEQISRAIEQVMQRATQQPATLSYFVKEILNPTKSNSRNKKGLKAKYESLIQQKLALNVGRSYRISDLIADLKDECIRSGTVFDNDLLNQVLDDLKSVK